MPAISLDPPQARLLAAWRQIAEEAQRLKENSDTPPAKKGGPRALPRAEVRMMLEDRRSVGGVHPPADAGGDREVRSRDGDRDRPRS